MPFLYGAQSQCKTLSFFPFYTFMLHPGLLGQNSISFSRLQFAQTFVPKPDYSEHGVQRSKAESGTASLQEPQAAHFLILKNTFSHLERRACTKH